MGPDPPPHSIVDLCLSVLNHVRAGRAALASSVAIDTPCITHTLAEDGTIDVRKVCNTLHHSLDEATTRDIAEIERSAMPDIHKAAKRRKLRLRLEPYRPRRTCLTLQALYDETGTPVADETAIGDLIADVWSPVFARREVDQEHMPYFLSFVPLDAGLTSWTWPRGQVASVASRMPPSAPGPDGLPYSFWAHAGKSAEDYVDDVAERATRGEPIPDVMLASHTLFPPQGGVPRRHRPGHATRDGTSPTDAHTNVHEGHCHDSEPRAHHHSR